MAPFHNLISCLFIALHCIFSVIFIHFAFKDIIKDLSIFHHFLWMFQGDLKIGACLGWSREALGEISELSELN